MDDHATVEGEVCVGHVVVNGTIIGPVSASESLANFTCAYERSEDYRSKNGRSFNEKFAD